MCFGDLEEKLGLNESINYEGVCRTDAATPGLLKKRYTYLKLHI